MKSEFLNKVAIVTGAGRGIGKGIAIRLAKEGCNVALCDIDINGVKETAKEIEKIGRKTLAIKTDVTKKNEVDGFVDKVYKKFNSIDILINNAGITLPAFITDLTEEDWDKTFNINLKSMFFTCKTVSPIMMKQRSGKIINMSSKSGKKGGLWLTAYCASKFGIIGFTQSLALDLAPFGINVNAVCPGIIFTPQWEYLTKKYAQKLKMPEKKVRDYYVGKIPLGRDGTSDDVANIIIFLCSNSANYMTGQAINVTGGEEMR